MIVWNKSAFEGLVKPRQAIALLGRAIEAMPHNAEPYLRLGNVYLDMFDFTAAGRAFEAALSCDPMRADIRVRLARTLTVQRRFREALATTSEAGEEPALEAERQYIRGIALLGLGNVSEADGAFRATLAIQPGHRRALMRYCQTLRRDGRLATLLEWCESLAAKGVDHAQLLLEWGRALALTGDMKRASALLFDPDRVTVTQLDQPRSFNAALAEDLLTNPIRISEFPAGEEANRGSSRVHHLLAGAHPEFSRTMMAVIRSAVDTAVAGLQPNGTFDPWTRAAPASAHLHAWGLIQRGGDHEAWHTHRGGWLSGVYYVRIPKGLSAQRGCIEYGPPPSIVDRAGNAIVSRRYPPEEGMLILAPSHYHHRTIPSGFDEDRISFAFDVIPDDKPAIT